ncbi:probable regulator of reproduction DopA [Cephalotrichum gorgonifer]|uniref:Probable regulator of reproduction DopA n=1 Tax=Cephalotrichum gorgonifer TaxID=2041049 RepID=A0AAE8MP94_9PEZI|nr:probable regulator of reproduction DopA [Cephalotrichum gorgonifer]
MAHDLASGRRSASPESSDRDSPLPRQWRNQLGSDDSPVKKDKHYRKYASAVERALSLFETNLQEWADYISFLNRLLKSLQSRPSSITTIPSRALVAQRLAQCLNPSLPSGVHQKSLEVYSHIFSVISREGLSHDLPLYFPGLSSTLSFASLSVRTPYLDLLETHFLGLNPRALRPAMKSIILALLPGLEDETSEEFERILRLLESFKVAIRPPDSEDIVGCHSTGDAFFWQCFFLASITGQSRRQGALAYLSRNLPTLADGAAELKGDGARNGTESDISKKLATSITSPEPGLLLRCFASGLGDDQILIQRGYLDLLVTHLPLNSTVLRSKVKPSDLELLLRAAVGVVTRRDMSLNRRLWSWLLGPDPGHGDPDPPPETPSSPENQQYITSKTSYFEEFGLQPLSRALLGMVNTNQKQTPVERSRPYRICLSLMDRWEIGGLVVPEVFLPIIDSVRAYKTQAASKADFDEVLRSASVFFDGVESGLIYGEVVGLLSKAIGPGNTSTAERMDKIALVNFIISNFNVREEEMVTIHAPLTALSILCLLGKTEELHRSRARSDPQFAKLSEAALGVAATLLDLVPGRAFPSGADRAKMESLTPETSTDTKLLETISLFYINEQGNIDISPPPLQPGEVGVSLLLKASHLSGGGLSAPGSCPDLAVRIRILVLLLLKIPGAYQLDGEYLLSSIHKGLQSASPVRFAAFSAMLALSTHLYSSELISTSQLSGLVVPFVRHAWSYLSSSDPKYHVETVRCLWQLQSALTPQNRDIEAAISELMIENAVNGSFAIRPPEPGRTFGVLWSHTLQDNPSQLERRGSKTPITETRLGTMQRLAGLDHYAVILTQPLFIMLDALLDERTQLFMAAKAWLNSMIGIDRLFLVLITKFADLPFLHARNGNGDTPNPGSINQLSEDDDLDLCVYYLRTVSNVLRWAPETIWSVLNKTAVPGESGYPDLSRITGVEGDVAIQAFLVQVCIRCIALNPGAKNTGLAAGASQLARSALTVLHQILLNPFASRLSAFHLETFLIDRLIQSLNDPDPYIQILLLDVVYASLKLQEPLPEDYSASPTSEKRPTVLDPNRRVSVSTAADHTHRSQPLPPTLLKCLRAGLSSPSSHPVLDSWIGFLTECLSMYSDSVFQILIPLVETLCDQVAGNFRALQSLFRESQDSLRTESSGPESTLISLLNGLEEVLASAHARLLIDEARTQVAKTPDQPQGFFGGMVSGVFASDTPQSRSATANDRLTVHLAFQDAIRICFTIWHWGQGDEAKALDPTSAASFNYTSLRMRNRARRLLEHLFAAETLECLETLVGIWRSSFDHTKIHASEVFNLFAALDGSRPKSTIPAIFNAIYSRTNPSALEPYRMSTLTIDLEDTDLVIFLVDYTRSLDDDAMDEIWADCMTFLRDLLGNPFPHRQTLPSLLEFAAILGEKVDNTNFGEQRKMRRELGDLFLRLLTALFTTRPIGLTDSSSSNNLSEKPKGDVPRRPTDAVPSERADDVVGILAAIVPNLPKILVEQDRVLTAATTISTNVLGPTIRSKGFPDTVSKSTLGLLHELSRLQGNQKTWKKDVSDAFNDVRFFASNPDLVRQDWLPLLKLWVTGDKERMPEIISRISQPTTAGIVFGVGATSARLEADRKTQLNLRRVATLILASAEDTFVTDLTTISDKLTELLGATSTSSPSATTRAEVYMVVRALVLKTSAVHLAMLWPIINAELHAAISSVVAPDHSAASDTYTNASVLQACKLLDLLICVSPDDFQLHEWLFVTDTIDAVYRSENYQPVAMVDELSEDLGSVSFSAGPHVESAAQLATSSLHRRPLLGEGGISDDISLERKDELVAKVLRPFFGQLSIFAFESTYAMGSLDREFCVRGLLKDLFDERTIVRAL